MITLYTPQFYMRMPFQFIRNIFKRSRMEHYTTHPSRTVQMVPFAHVERLLRFTG